MTCDVIKPLISEYSDGRLISAKHAQVESHLAHCPACSRLAQDFQTLTGLLHGLPLLETSRGFDADLADRLARTRASSQHVNWRERLAGLLRPQPIFWRPAIALCAAAAAIGGVVFLQRPASPPPVSPALSEGALVTHCVEQHRSYVAGQPLSDLAAQNLANQLDDGAGTAASSSDGAAL
jgi:anti-sigma factor RsiW